MGWGSHGCVAGRSCSWRYSLLPVLHGRCQNFFSLLSWTNLYNVFVTLHHGYPEELSHTCIHLTMDHDSTQLMHCHAWAMWNIPRLAISNIDGYLQAGRDSA